MKNITLAVIATAAGLAHAGHSSMNDRVIPSDTHVDAAAFTYTIDVSGISFNDAQGSALNHTLDIYAGLSNEIIGIGWDVNLTTIGPSWASEATIVFQDQIELVPAIREDFPVTNQNYSSNGILNLYQQGLDNIVLTNTPYLNIEFFDTFVDHGGTGDAYFEAGSVLYIQHIYPSPNTLALLSFAGIASSRRRRHHN